MYLYVSFIYIIYVYIHPSYIILPEDDPFHVKLIPQFFHQRHGAQVVFNNLGGQGPGHLDEPKELRFANVAAANAGPLDLAPGAARSCCGHQVSGRMWSIIGIYIYYYDLIMVYYDL